MEKIEGTSMNMVKERIEKIKELFPEVVTEEMKHQDALVTHTHTLCYRF